MFSRLRVEGQYHGVSKWPRHINGSNLFISGISRGNKHWNIWHKYGNVTMATKIRFHIGFRRSLGPYFVAILEGCKIDRSFEFRYRTLINKTNYVIYNYFCYDDIIQDVAIRLWIFSDFSSRKIIAITSGDILYHIPVRFLFDCVPSIRRARTITTNSDLAGMQKCSPSHSIKKHGCGWYMERLNPFCFIQYLIIVACSRSIIVQLGVKKV